MSGWLWSTPEPDGRNNWASSYLVIDGVRSTVAISRDGRIYVWARNINGRSESLLPAGTAQAILACYAYAQRFGGAL